MKLLFKKAVSQDYLSPASTLINKIHELYPQIGECDIDLKVNWDEDRNAWAVNFKKGVHRIKHYLEDEDAATCMEGKQCVSLGLEFGQFVYGVS